jgi:ATP-dependent HslUV protease ATP-binding subunit HslU
MTPLTPRQIVAELDRYIVGQDDAKRAVAVAIRNRWRRQQLPEDVGREIVPKNIIMSGPTGVGKTEIARRLASLVGAPFIKVEATKFTEVGYFGRDVESMVRDLVEGAMDLVREEMTQAVKEPAEKAVEERVLDALLPAHSTLGEDEEARERRGRTRDRFREQLRSGELEEREIEINIERKAQVMGVLGGGAPGMELDPEMQGMIERMLPSKRETKRLSVADARRILFSQEADKLIDRDKITQEAVERVEQSGIIFLDEIDKIAGSGREGPGGGGGPDVSRQGVQRDLLPIVEGSTVITKHGPVKTDHILFIAAGAFHSSKPSDLMPELQGRFPIRVELKDLSKDDFVRILREPKNALTEQQKQLLSTEGVSVEFADDAIELIAKTAFDVNRRQQNIGARRLYTILERVFEEASFNAPEMKGQNLRISADYVRQKLGDVVKDEDLSRFIL